MLRLKLRLRGSLLALALLLGSPALAQAAEQDHVDIGVADRPGGGATVSVRAQHDSVSTGQSAGTAATQASSGAGTCRSEGREIPCFSRIKGAWSSDRECYVKREPTVVSAEEPYDGHTEGSVYSCESAASRGGGRFGVGAGSFYTFWAPDPGSAGAPMVADPVQVARMAIERMNLAAPSIGMTPLDSDAPLLVGVDAWFWVANTGQRGLGPITRTATAGPTTVRATASVAKVTWDLGDGTKITCRGAGTPWTPDKGVGPSPTCGHRYVTPSSSQAKGTYTIRATTHWNVDWAGAGRSGSIPLSLSGVRELDVIEVQVLQTS